MKRKLCFMSLISISVLLAGCDYNRKMPTTQIPAQQSFYIQNEQTMAGGVYPLGDFHRIAISGQINATIHGHALQNEVTANAPPDVLSNLKVWVRNDVLYITNQHHTYIPVVINMTHPVEHVRLMGNGKFDLDDLGQSPLDLSLSGNTKTVMNGNFVLQRLNITDTAHLKMYWINSSHLTVHASGHSSLFLAGVVTNLDVTAIGHSKVNGKYLRAENSYVLTRDSAQVGVNVKHALGTQSFNSSSVYYYRDPQFSGIYLNGPGSALRMTGISTDSNKMLH